MGCLRPANRGIRPPRRCARPARAGIWNPCARLDGGAEDHASTPRRVTVRSLWWIIVTGLTTILWAAQNAPGAPFRSTRDTRPGAFGSTDRWCGEAGSRTFRSSLFGRRGRVFDGGVGAGQGVSNSAKSVRNRTCAGRCGGHLVGDGLVAQQRCRVAPTPAIGGVGVALIELLGTGIRNGHRFTSRSDAPAKEPCAEAQTRFRDRPVTQRCHP